MAPKFGKVKQVVCKDFVTYSDFTFKATDYLNLIIGPNGTGKSTVIAAIFLGLGGDPKFFGRSSNLADYVRNGGTNATVSVELFANNEGSASCFFRREFDRDNHCEFYVDDKKVSKVAYLQKVSSFNVQINNLCQFLPQDRLHEFTSMNAEDLFLNTMIAVYGADAKNDLDQLKALRYDQLSKKKEMADKEQRIQNLKLKIQSLQEGLERYNKRQLYAKQVLVCKAKLMWLEATEIKEKLEELMRDYKAAKEMMETKKIMHDDLIMKQQKTTKITKQYEHDIEQKTQEVDKYERKITQMQKTYFELKKKIEEENHNYEMRKRRANERHKELENLEKLAHVHDLDYRELKEKLESEIGNVDEEKLERDFRAHQSEIQHQIQVRTDLGMKLDTNVLPSITKIRARLEKLRNKDEQKLQFLRRQFPDVIKAMEWLNANKERFERHVYNPVLMELSVLDLNDSKFVENTIQLRDLLAFTCESREDMAIITNELCVKQKLSINTIFSPPAKSCRFKPKHPIENLRQFGFKNYLLNLLEGPPVILNSLCNLCNLHNIPVSNDDVTCEADDLPGIGQYFGGDFRFNVSVSQYTQHKSLMQVRIKPKHILSRNDLSDEVVPLERSLKKLVQSADQMRNERTNIEAKINRIQHACDELSKQRTELRSRKNKLQELYIMAQRKHEQIAAIRKELEEYTDDKEAVAEKIKKICKKMMLIPKEQLNELKSYQDISAKLNFIKTFLRTHKSKIAHETELLRGARQQLEQAENLLKTVQHAVHKKERDQEELMKELLKLTDNVLPTNKKYTYYAEFNELPENEEEIQSKINEYQARSELMEGEKQNILEQYEMETKKLEDLQDHITDIQNQYSSSAENINLIYLPWKQKISNIVASINERFVAYSTSMGFRGEVRLEHGDEHDFDKYGIRIMVQFRAVGELLTLDRTVQSGGERSLSIAVYTLSLQQLTQVPFRCVDEINQGMDSTNERKVFDMLLNETTRDESSQYFFVTPKLLPNLPHNPRMTVHIIFNGLFMDKNIFKLEI